MYRIVKTRSRSTSYVRYILISEKITPLLEQKGIRTSRSAGRFIRTTCTPCHASNLFEKNKNL